MWVISSLLKAENQIQAGERGRKNSVRMETVCKAKDKVKSVERQQQNIKHMSLVREEEDRGQTTDECQWIVHTWH